MPPQSAFLPALSLRWPVHLLISSPVAIQMRLVPRLAIARRVEQVLEERADLCGIAAVDDRLGRLSGAIFSSAIRRAGLGVVARVAQSARSGWDDCCVRRLGRGPDRTHARALTAPARDALLHMFLQLGEPRLIRPFLGFDCLVGGERLLMKDRRGERGERGRSREAAEQATARQA